MPELPEVEFCRRALTRWSRGRQVVGVEVPDPRVIRARRTDRPTAGRPDGVAALTDVVRGAPCGEVLRHGKRLLWCFGTRALLLTLGMTGKWSRDDGPWARVRLRLDDGTRVVFHDPRLLGGIVPCDLGDGTHALRDGLGPDALDGLPPRPRARAPVKQVLMDQSWVAGLGNVQVMEALWRAHVHPATPCADLDDAAWARLTDAVAAQLAHTLGLLGDGDHIVYVEESRASNPFEIYRREGQLCPACGTAIARMVQAGRSTYWCPACQPATA